MDRNMEDVDKRVEWLHCEPNFAGDIFGEPQKTTRIGDEYQAQIPSLMTKNDEVKIDDQDHFDFGLSIPVTWVRSQHKKKKKNKKKERIAIEAKGKSGKIGSKRKNRLLALPCSSVEESWSVIEQDSFILGLYIFGKNLRVVNQFMGNKGMPHVISFYYGKFYRSEQHQKWSMYIKKRRTKSSPGRKTLRGWRRQELLSRLLPNISDECKTRLTQVISAFEEGKLSFDDYVFSLRDTLGIKLLVEAVAVGKEKQDLTANDEAVKKKRHSEQPTTYASKQSLAFLPPDVEKFSKRGLEKGSQYFDSLTEVLNKVASHPHLHTQNLTRTSWSSHTSLAGLVKVRELTCLQSSGRAADMQASSSVTVETKQVTTEEAQNKDVNHKTAEIHGVANSTYCETSEVSDIRNDDSRGEDESMKDPRPEKKRRSIVLGLNNPRVGPYSLVSTKQSVSSATVSNQGELSNGASNSQRHSTRNRPLTVKALESLANGLLDPETKRKRSDDTTPKRVRAKTALVSSCGAPTLKIT
ncbi:homeodomain-like protein [Tanacetum coccineum]